MLWCGLAIVLAVYGTLRCVVTVLSPDKLTPIVCKVANGLIDADVEMSTVELSAMNTYPFLRLRVDSLRIVNPHMQELKSDTSLHLPDYADTLLTLERFVGELNMPKLLVGAVSINDITFDRPAVNVVIVNDSINNFDIFPAGGASEETSAGTRLPDIELRHFSIENSEPFRYFDASGKMSAAMEVKTLVERNDRMPSYELRFEGDLASGLLSDYNLAHLPLTLDGDIVWKPDEASRIALKDFTLGVERFKVDFSVDADFTDGLILNDLKVRSGGIGVTDILAFVPQDIARKYELDALKTDAAMSVSFGLDRAFILDRDSIPYATLTFAVDPCMLRYGNARFERFAASVTAMLRGNDLSEAVVTLDSLAVAGPATALKLSGRVTDVTGDPEFKIRLDGYTNLAKLPPPLMKYVDGYISGRVKTEIDMAGRLSMFDRNNFHKLKADGDIDGRNLYWLSSDTANMAFVRNVCFKFGTKMRFNNSSDLLAAKISADSAEVLSGGVSVNMADLSLGVGVENSRPSADTTLVIPMGGALKLAKLNVSSITDSAGVRFREIAGNVVMRRFNDMSRVPEFVFNLSIDRMAAGSPDARMLFSRSRLEFNAHKLPVGKQVLRMRKTIDSIAKSRPDLSPDSVMALAVAKRRQQRGRYHRVHAETTDSATEIIEWGTSKAFDRLLLTWDLKGLLTADRASLFTPYFPLRNRLRNLNISFNNDSICLRQIAYKVGRSDFLADGTISNIKRALTSRRRLSPLKVDFDAYSDTVDVNQIAEGFFRGAAYSHLRSKGVAADLSVVDDDESFEREIDKTMAQSSDTMAPVLIPANVEANLNVRARNILYSDLLLHDMTGNVLVYDGAVNLHRLKASSDVGSVDLSALYSAPTADDMRFGFGLQVSDFDISRFIGLVPAIDSIMPLLRDISGIIDADVAATVNIGRDMNLDLPSLTAAIKLEGDSLQLLDAETFRTIAKWLMFKNKKRNIIDHMNVEMIIADNEMQLFPFIFDIDRYKIGVQGHNDLALNFNYLVSVLKSPLPFKFGITLKGNPDDYKIRLGRAKFDEKQAVERKQIVDTARVNLIDQIENVFRRGVRRSEFARLKLPEDKSAAADINLESDPVTAADSLLFIQEGLIPAPVEPDGPVNEEKKKK